MDGIDSSNLQTQITTNSNDISNKQNVIDSSSIINCDSLNTTGNVVVGDIWTQYD